jgi:uncharacterized protein (TIGR03435 family)
MLKRSLWCQQALAAVLILYTASELHGQNAGPPRFDVVSVKLIDPNVQGEHTHEKSDPGRLTMTATMHRFVARAYGLTDGQLGGEPDWFGTRLYTLEGVTGTAVGPDQMTLMLRTALADRFQLRLREETREMAVYTLQVAPGGRKFQELPPGQSPRPEPSAPEGVFARTFTSVSGLVNALNGVYGGILKLDRVVVDRTGLTARYEIHLKTSLEVQADDFGHRVQLLPNLTRDLQSELGLRMVPERIPMQYFVVERAAPPDAN